MNIGCGDAFGQIDVEPLNNWLLRWTKLPTVSPLWRFSECCCIWASAADAWLMHLCWLLFISSVGWNLHASTVIGCPLSGDRWLFPMNHILCSIGQINIGIYSVKHLKANTLQQLLEGSKLEEGALWSWKRLLWHSLGALIVKGMMDQCKYAYVLADHIHP